MSFLAGAGLFGLFLAAFVAATPLPFQSEILFVAVLAIRPLGPQIIFLRIFCPGAGVPKRIAISIFDLIAIRNSLHVGAVILAVT